MEFVLPSLLTVIMFLLAGLYFDLKKVSRNVDQLRINEAGNNKRLEALEKKIDNLEIRMYGKG